MSDENPSWQENVYQLFKQHNIRQVIYVPDAGHAPLIDRCLQDPEMKTGPLTNEFEGPGMCAGAWLGGERSVLHMGQSTTSTLESSGVVCNRADSAEEVPPVVESSINLAFHSYAQVAVIISQRVMGTKVFV